MGDIVFPLSSLPKVRETGDHVTAGEWSFDPKEDNDEGEAWAAAKAWAAYALHLRNK